jgi:flagellar basal body-associated protein FliL
VDEILNQIDEGFQATLDELKSEVGKIDAPPQLESISIGADYLKEAESKLKPDEDDPIADLDDDLLAAEISMAIKVPSTGASFHYGPSFWRALGNFIWETAVFIPRFILSLFSHLRQLRTVPPRELLSGIPSLFGTLIPPWRASLQELIGVLRTFTRRTYLKLGLAMLLTGVLVLLARDIGNRLNPDSEKDPFLRSFSEVANTVQVIPQEDESEDLESPLRHPEYTVLLPRVVANLKAPSPRQSPMIALQVYVEASNQDCAIEMRDREMEIKDIISRQMEQLTFDELDTLPGKGRLKNRIRMGLNRVLNKGNAKRVFFKSLHIKK